jgi:hypothetical protein
VDTGVNAEAAANAAASRLNRQRESDLLPAALARRRAPTCASEPPSITAARIVIYVVHACRRHTEERSTGVDEREFSSNR